MILVVNEGIGNLLIRKYGASKKKVVNLRLSNKYWYFVPFRIFWLKPVRNLRRKILRLVKKYIG